MIDRSEAEEHLRVIRSLMEKATIYRAISAEAAAVGGVLAVLASFAFGNWLRTGEILAGRVSRVPSEAFFGLWLIVLLVTAAANVWCLWRGAQRRGEAFISPGMRLACRALLPSYIVASFFTVLLFGIEMPGFIVPVWIICHGLALLSTTCFAPRSLGWLGWAFLAMGLASCWAIGKAAYAIPIVAGGADVDALAHQRDWRSLLLGQQWMALTFGLLHLIYAACTWPRRAR
jgi:hypothetical protein